MPSQLGTAVLDIVTDNRRFDQGIAKAERSARGLETTFVQSSRRIVNSVKSIGLALGTAFTVDTVIRFTTEAIQSAAAIQDAADAANIGSEALQRYRFAGEQSGLMVEEIDRGLRTFTTNLGRFRTSGAGPAAETPRRLGLTSDITSGKFQSNDEVLEAVLKRLAGIKDGAQRAAAAGEIFGNRLGPKLAALLAQGYAAVQRLIDQAPVLSAAQVEAADKIEEKYNEVTGHIWVWWQERVIAGAMNAGRAMEELTFILNTLANHPIFAATPLGMGLEFLVGDFTTAELAVNALNLELSGLETRIRTLQALQDPKGAFYIEERQPEIAAELAKLEAERSVLLDRLANRQEKIATGLDKIGTSASAATEETDALGESLEKLKLPPLEEAAPTTPAERFRTTLPGREAEARFGAGVVGEEFAVPMPSQDAIEALRALSTDSKAFLDHVQLLQPELQSAAGMWNDYAASISGTESPLHGMIKLEQTLGQVMNQQNLTLADRKQNLADVMAFNANALQTLFGETKAWAIAEAVIQTALAVTKALASVPPPYSFVLAGITAALGAAQIAAITSEEFAKGGTFKGEGPILVGEKGPELIFPETGGRVFSAPDTKQMLAEAEVMSGIPAFQAGGVFQPGQLFTAGEQGEEIIFSPAGMLGEGNGKDKEEEKGFGGLGGSLLGAALPFQQGGTFGGDKPIVVGEKGPEMVMPQVAGRVLDASETAKLLSSIPAFQGGGRFGAGQPLFAGEAGRELVMPEVSGRISEPQETRRMMAGMEKGGGTVIQHLEIGSGTRPETIAMMEQALRRLDASVEQRSVTAVTAARRRDPTLFGRGRS